MSVVVETKVTGVEERTSFKNPDRKYWAIHFEGLDRPINIFDESVAKQCVSLYNVPGTKIAYTKNGKYNNLDELVSPGEEIAVEGVSLTPVGEAIATAQSAQVSAGQPVSEFRTPDQIMRGQAMEIAAGDPNQAERIYDWIKNGTPDEKVSDALQSEEQTDSNGTVIPF